MSQTQPVDVVVKAPALKTFLKRIPVKKTAAIALTGAAALALASIAKDAVKVEVENDADTPAED